MGNSVAVTVGLSIETSVDSITNRILETNVVMARLATDTANGSRVPAKAQKKIHLADCGSYGSGIAARCQVRIALLSIHSPTSTQGIRVLCKPFMQVVSTPQVEARFW